MAQKIKLSTVYLLGLGLLLSGIVIGLIGYIYPDNWILSGPISAFYANASIELVSISITTLIIDSLYQRRQHEQLKRQLIREMGGKDNGIALRAVRELAAFNHLSDGSLVEAELLGANLCGAHLSGANLKDSILIQSNLQNAYLDNANLHKAVLYNADLTDAHLAGANLTEANLFKSRLKGASLFKAKLYKADLGNVSLFGADLRKADLRKAVLIKADLKNANLAGTNLSASKYDCDTRWPKGFDPKKAGSLKCNKIPKTTRQTLPGS